MVKFFFFAIVNISILHAQVQIGSTIYGIANNDRYGESIDLDQDGNTVVIGGPAYRTQNTQRGFIQVFENVSGNWIQKGGDIIGNSNNNSFGFSVAISSDGNTVVASDPFYNTNNQPNNYGNGQVKVYQWDSSRWVLKGSPINQLPSDSARLGLSVDINSSGSVIAISSFTGIPAFRGSVQVYEWANSNWNLKGTIIRGLIGEKFAEHLTLNNSGDRVAASISYGNGSSQNSGVVKVFDFVNNSWGLMGNPINGSTPFEDFGSSLDFNHDGSSLAIGANFYNHLGNNSAGMVRVMRWNGSNWTPYGQDIFGKGANHYLGQSVSFNHNGNLLAIGSNGDTTLGPHTGKVEIYKDQNGIWVSTYTILGLSSGNNTGWSVALDSAGNTVAVGENGCHLNCAGSARIFQIGQTVGFLSNDIENSNFSIYPNPFYDRFDLHFKIPTNAIIKLRDVGGKVVEEKQLNQANKVAFTPNIPSGIYFLELLSADGKRNVQKIVKQ